ncbi:MAG: AraC family transcriptional regulator [Flavobacteriaceae bacterium]|nr:MAG: AraC family transcriptional regulator [Flavobacteriaceae bacterium]
MEQIIKINSIEQLHEILNLDKPEHPLITVINISDIEIPQEMVGVKVVTNMYYIALKDAHCGLEYGMSSYDFDNGMLLFTAPHQAFSATKPLTKNEEEGWMLFFHPDFLKKSFLAKKIVQYNFFGYQANEALHLSKSERNILTNIISNIREEYIKKTDSQSQNIIISNLELLLNYSLRFYERQFTSRSVDNQDIIAEFETLLNTFQDENLLSKNGIPTIHQFAEKMNVSSNYLSNLVRKVTGISAKDHINNLVLRKAEEMLLGSDNSISEIAYLLGFNYPHYFTRFFKLKTGITPSNYRKINNYTPVIHVI